MESSQKPRGWLASGVVGLLIGAAAAGGPLWYQNTQLQSRLNASNSAVARMQADKEQLEAEASQLEANQSKLEQTTQQLQARTREDQAAMQAQQVHAAELAKPDLPIQVTFRHALLSQGLVLTMKNDSAADLAVLAQFAGTGSRSHVYRIVIGPSQVKEIGAAQGWAFTPGDQVVIANPGYRPISLRVP